jgi:hypothetical protein
MLFQRAMNNLKPGGWVEMADFAGAIFSDDDSMEKAPYLTEWARLNQEAFRKFGKDLGIAGQHKQRMIDAGFKNVREEVYKVCLLSYPSTATAPFVCELVAN